MKLTDPATNWSFDCLTDPSGNPLPGGIVIQNVTQDGHNFAKDIRVIGFWLETELVTPGGPAATPAKKFYILDSATFTVSAVRTLTPKPAPIPALGTTFDYLKEADTALDFTQYFKSGWNYVAFGVAAKFDGPGLLNSFTNCEYSDLSIEQIFLFSRYSNTPKHEPSGALQAARFHPLVRYTFTKNPAFNDKVPYTRVNSIRFDYRLHLYLDRSFDTATNATLAQLGNQAGLFADSDTVSGTTAVSVGSGVWNIFKKNTVATAVSAGAFDAVEKPLVLEISAPGLAKGFPKFDTTPSGGGAPVTVRCWDNVHWWGVKGPGGRPLISAPGAFHAAHIHWRWGEASKAAGAGSDPIFNPSTYPAGMTVPSSVKGMWGPLLDPGIWIQSLSVAVVKNDPALDPNRGVPLANLSKDKWNSLFTGLRSIPADITIGDDIVLWYSAQVHSSITPAGSSSAYTSKPTGTVFLHGIFFAHDAERTGFPVGSTDPTYRPTDEATIRSAKQWVRQAS